MTIFPIYIETYTIIWGKIYTLFKKIMYRQKSVIFTIGKTLYIRKGWARTKKEKVSYLPIYIGNTLQKGDILLYIYKETLQNWASHK